MKGKEKDRWGKMKGKSKEDEEKRRQRTGRIAQWEEEVRGEGVGR